ncbi:alpha-acetolactate decarboxylase [Trichoderma austrokoningii]
MAYNELYQYSVVSALMEGLGEHGLPYKQLVSHGDHGLGTFRRMDGEMIALDGQVYQMKADGSIIKVDSAGGSEIAPFAQLTRFQATATADVEFKDKHGFSAALSNLLPKTKNYFVAFRVDGVFKCVAVRTAGGQFCRHENIRELHKRQTTYEFTNVRGSVIGFRSPEFLQGVGVAGDHLHFISEERDRGGHVLEITTLEGSPVKLSAAVQSKVHLEFPEDDDYKGVNLAVDADRIRAVEG